MSARVCVGGCVSAPSQSCLTLYDPMDCSPPGSSVHGILQARVLEWGAISSSRGIFPIQDSNLGLLYWGQILYPLNYEGCPQYSSVAQLCPTLCDPMNHSTPGLPVHYQLPEFTQTHAHWVGDASQPSSTSVIPFSSCPQSFPASGSFPMSRLFASGGQSIGVCKYSNISPSNEHPGLISFRMDWLDLLAVQGTLKISRVFSNTTVQKHQFFSPQLSLWSNSHIHTWLREKP